MGISAAAEVEKALADVPREWRIERAKAWLSVRPAAIDGEHGDPTTWNTLLCAAKTFGLTDVAMVGEAFVDWNARCVPPWEGSQWSRNLERAIESDHVPWATDLSLIYSFESLFRKKAS